MDALIHGNMMLSIMNMMFIIIIIIIIVIIIMIVIDLVIVSLNVKQITWMMSLSALLSNLR